MAEAKKKAVKRDPLKIKRDTDDLAPHMLAVLKEFQKDSKDGVIWTVSETSRSPERAKELAEKAKKGGGRAIEDSDHIRNIAFDILPDFKDRVKKFQNIAKKKASKRSESERAFFKKYESDRIKELVRRKREIEKSLGIKLMHLSGDANHIQLKKIESNKAFIDKHDGDAGNFQPQVKKQTEPPVQEPVEDSPEVELSSALEKIEAMERDVQMESAIERTKEGLGRMPQSTPDPSMSIAPTAQPGLDPTRPQAVEDLPDVDLAGMEAAPGAGGVTSEEIPQDVMPEDEPDQGSRVTPEELAEFRAWKQGLEGRLDEAEMAQLSPEEELRAQLAKIDPDQELAASFDEYYASEADVDPAQPRESAAVADKKNQPKLEKNDWDLKDHISRMKYVLTDNPEQAVALLEKRYGKGNAQLNEKSGNVEFKKDGKWIEIDPDGIQFYDYADFLWGALRAGVGVGSEIVVGTAGAALGMFGAGPLGAGAGAVGGVAAGGAAEAAFGQTARDLFGVPSDKSIEDEMAMGSALNMAFMGGGFLARNTLRSFAAGAKHFFPSLNSGGLVEMQESIARIVKGSGGKTKSSKELAEQMAGDRHVQGSVKNIVSELDEEIITAKDSLKSAMKRAGFKKIPIGGYVKNVRSRLEAAGFQFDDKTGKMIPFNRDMMNNQLFSSENYKKDYEKFQSAFSDILEIQDKGGYTVDGLINQIRSFQQKIQYDPLRAPEDKMSKHGASLFELFSNQLRDHRDRAFQSVAKGMDDANPAKSALLNAYKNKEQHMAAINYMKKQMVDNVEARKNLHKLIDLKNPGMIEQMAKFLGNDPNTSGGRLWGDIVDKWKSDWFRNSFDARKGLLKPDKMIADLQKMDDNTARILFGESRGKLISQFAELVPAIKKINNSLDIDQNSFRPLKFITVHLVDHQLARAQARVNLLQFAAGKVNEGVKAAFNSTFMESFVVKTLRNNPTLIRKYGEDVLGQMIEESDNAMKRQSYRELRRRFNFIANVLDGAPSGTPADSMRTFAAQRRLLMNSIDHAWFNGTMHEEASGAMGFDSQGQKANTLEGAIIESEMKNSGISSKAINDTVINSDIGYNPE